MKRVYLDNNATTAMHPEVREAIVEALHLYGNPSSHHAFGREAREPIEQARSSVAEMLGAAPDNIIFTSGGSESNNLVLKEVACRNKACDCGAGLAKKGRHIITTQVEHPSVLETCRCLSIGNVDVTFLPVDKYGRVSVEDVEKAIRDDTALISIMYANNEVGTIQPIREIGEIAKKRGIRFHTDAVQVAGKLPVNVDELGVHYLSLSGHKLNGPKGVGALYIRPGSEVCPLIYGGHQERGRRAGTENTLGIIGLGKAAEVAMEAMTKNIAHMSSLRDKLEKGLTERIPHTRVNGHPEYRLPNTTNISFQYVEGEAILYRLDAEGIAVSTGSACSSGSLDPSHVLMAMNVPIEMAHGSIRFSLGHETTAQEIDYVIDRVAKSIEKLRALSPLYRKK